MGNSKFHTLIKVVERYVLQTFWKRNNQCYALKMNINCHREAFNNTERESQHVPYALPHERTRVTRILHSIDRTKVYIVSAETTIKFDLDKVESFEETAKFLLLCCPTPKAQEDYFQRISALKKGGGISGSRG